jgi:hypothetical protein
VFLALAAIWQGYVQGAPQLYVTAAIALIAKGVLIPIYLRRMIMQLPPASRAEPASGIGASMIAGFLLVGLSILVVLPATAGARALARSIESHHPSAATVDDAETALRRVSRIQAALLRPHLPLVGETLAGVVGAPLRSLHVPARVIGGWVEACAGVGGTDAGTPDVRVSVGSIRVSK